MRIIIKNVSVEAYYSISIVKHYHKPLQQVYSIITIEISDIKPDLTLQMSFKAMNNSVGPIELVFTLLVFGIYLRMTR